MKKVVLHFAEHHTFSANELAKIAASDWPVLKVDIVEGNYSWSIDGEHAKECTECKAEMLDGLE